MRVSPATRAYPLRSAEPPQQRWKRRGEPAQYIRNSGYLPKETRAGQLRGYRRHLRLLRAFGTGHRPSPYRSEPLHQMNQQPTDQAKNALPPLPGEPHLGAAAGSFGADFPESAHYQASGWRQLLSWALGLVMLFALVLVVLHFGTIEEFTRLAWA